MEVIAITWWAATKRKFKESRKTKWLPCWSVIMMFWWRSMSFSGSAMNHSRKWQSKRRPYIIKWKWMLIKAAHSCLDCRNLTMKHRTKRTFCFRKSRCLLKTRSQGMRILRHWECRKRSLKVKRRFWTSNLSLYRILTMALLPRRRMKLICSQKKSTK